MSAADPDSRYIGTFVQADEKGDYVNLGRTYKIRIEGDSLVLADVRIQLIRVKGAARVGHGASLIFLDAHNVANRVTLTTNNLFGIAIGRSKRLDEFVDSVNKAAQRAKGAVSAQEAASAQKIAPADTCHDCGAPGGAPLAFGRIYGMVTVTRWSTAPGVYCKTHATQRGVRSLLATALLGWWSLVGALRTPAYIQLNMRSLRQHSTLSPLLITAMAIAAYLPGLALVLLVYFAVKNWR